MNSFSAVYSAAVAESADVLQVGLGPQHSCAVIAGGSVHCWGLHTKAFHTGRAHAMSDVKATRVVLGDGKSYAILESGDAVAFHDNKRVPIAGLADAVELAVGSVHMCALTNNAQVACWGTNLHGALGRPGVIESKSPVIVRSLKVPPVSR